MRTVTCVLTLGALSTGAFAGGARTVAVLDPDSPSFAPNLGPPGTTPSSDGPRVERALAPSDDGPQPTFAAALSADAASDRAFVRSTAGTLRQGQFDFSFRTAVEHGSMLSIAAGLGHAIEFSADVGYSRDLGSAGGFGLKIGVAQHRTWAVAVDGSLSGLGIAGQGLSGEGLLAAAEVALTTCAASCTLLYTIGGGMAFPIGDTSAPASPFLEISAIFGTGVVRPLVEGIALDHFGKLAFAGLRFGGRHVAVDAGVGLVTLDDVTQNGAAMMVGLGVRP
jgi:hypothetical protein